MRVAVNFVMVAPDDCVLLANDAIFAHEVRPVFQLVVYVNVPDGTTHRRCFVDNCNRYESLNEVVEVVFFLVVHRYEIGIKIAPLLPIERDPVHHVGQGQLWLVSSGVKVMLFTCLRVLHHHLKVGEWPKLVLLGFVTPLSSPPAATAA